MFSATFIHLHQDENKQHDLLLRVITVNRRLFVVFVCDSACFTTARRKKTTHT